MYRRNTPSPKSGFLNQLALCNLTHDNSSQACRIFFGKLPGINFIRLLIRIRSMLLRQHNVYIKYVIDPITGCFLSNCEFMNGKQRTVSNACCLLHRCEYLFIRIEIFFALILDFFQFSSAKCAMREP